MRSATAAGCETVTAWDASISTVLEPARSAMVENALAVAGPVRETYLTGPRDTDEPTAWRTEIGWPVFRVGSRRAGRQETT